MFISRQVKVLFAEVFVVALLASSTMAPETDASRGRYVLPVQADTQRVCPAGDAELRSAVDHLLTNKYRADSLAEIGVPRDTSQMRLLTDERDRATCKAIQEAIGVNVSDTSGFREAIYQVGDFYIIPSLKTPPTDPGDFPVTFGNVTIFDHDLNPEASYIY